MNIMKKKPELFKRTGKPSLTLRNFLNNLKDNDLHYENKQITQCVFLGVLRLKPVPSVFSSNVPSVSTTSESTKTKRLKNSANKELNKNVSNKTNINKVLSGKVSKKNPEKVKAAVKKVPSRRSNIKIKLNTKEKIYPKLEPSTSSSIEESSSNMSNTVSPDSIIAKTSLKLNPILSPTKFNPVQNLFDKLKQQRDESYTEPGPSKLKLHVKTKEDLKSTSEKYKVCKISASGQNSFNANGSRKLKKTLHKKSQERLQCPTTSTSPITISDTESTGKKDKDDVICVDETNSNSSHSSGKERVIIEDIIIINDDTQSKRTSPRNKAINQERTYQEAVDNRNVLPEEPKSRQSSNNTVATALENETTKQLTDRRQCQEVIVIPDEPNKEKIKSNPSKKQSDQKHDGDREKRVSPRHKKLEEKPKEVEVVLIEEEGVSTINPEPETPSKNFMNTSKTQELNVTIDSEQNKNKSVKNSPRLLKTVTVKEKMTYSVKKELIESSVDIVSEKPKRKKNTMLPSLIPSMLLNAPMLLRSELAQKKNNSMNVEKSSKKSKDKVRISSNLKCNTLTAVQTKTIYKNTSSQHFETHSNTSQLEKIQKTSQEYIVPLNVSTVHRPEECLNGSLTEEVVCLTNTVQNKDVNINIDNLECEGQSKTSPKSVTVDQEELSEKSKQKTKSKECTVQKSKILNKTSQKSDVKDDDVIIVEVKDSPKETDSVNLMEISETNKKNSNIEEEPKTQSQISPRTQNSVPEVRDFINLVEEPDKNMVSPRTLRSNQLKKSLNNETSLIEDTILINDDEAPSQKEKTSPRTKRTIQQTPKANSDETSILNESSSKKPTQKSSTRLLRPKSRGKSSIKTEVEEHDEPKNKQENELPPSGVVEDISPTPGRQKKNLVLENTRWLRSDSCRKIKEESPPIKNPRVVKLENNSVLDTSDLGTSKNSRNSLNTSDRLLRSVVKKETASAIKDTEVVESARQLRSETNSQNIVIEKPVTLRGIGKRLSPQKSPQSNETHNLPEQPCSTDVEKESFTEELHTTVSGESTAKKSSKNVLNRQSKTVPISKKVVAAKKEGRNLNRKAKSTLLTSDPKKTSMLLRSELAQLKNVSVISVSDIKTNVKKPIRKKGVKSEDLDSNNQLNVTSNEKSETNNCKKNKNKVKNEISKVSEEEGQKITREENVDTNRTNESVAKEVSIISEENKSPKANKTLSKLKKNTTEEEKSTKIVSPKRNSGRTRKNSKRKANEVTDEDRHEASEELTTTQPVPYEENLQISEECDITANKSVDTTIFDFDETEPEVLPLRLSDSLKKEKTTPATSTPSKPNVTPKRKVQKTVEEPVTKAQTKAKLFSVFDDKSVEKDSNNKSTAKTKSVPKKKIVEEKSNTEELSSQNETATTKKSKKKVSANKNNTSESEPSQDNSSNTSKTVSPTLKQTKITDMFNKVLLKKEKAAVDSVFERSPKEPPKPQEEKITENTKPDMPPPRPSRKASSIELEENNPYEDDSDCDSRMEWIPEEYAEYKFKYSAKKMMTYKPIHKCKICLLILPTYYKLTKHKLEHAKTENPYNCKHCDQAFSNIEDLTAHLRIHKGKLPYTCKKCDKGFWSKKSLDAHTPIHVLRKVKQPNKRFRCDVCAKEFSKLCDMERHTRVHTGEKPCVCNICNKRFQQSHNLSKHLLTHLHVKPFHCEICNKQFGRNDVLNRHLLTHSVEKPIKCPLCPKGFIRQTQLNNHMKKNHPDAAKIGAVSETK